MMVWVNGERAATNGATNVAELAAHYGLHPKAVLIEHNATALHQREWTQRPLAEGDRIEFVRVVAGG
ncbi:MAG: sulfur carrier protein ThiS [Verrucomicrobiota bacterium]|nr:sulfur carrier protein ThiS [Verrucomicrobiota bacterium]